MLGRIVTTRHFDDGNESEVSSPTSLAVVNGVTSLQDFCPTCAHHSNNKGQDTKKEAIGGE